MASSEIDSSFQPHPQFMKLKEKGADDCQVQLATVVFLDLCESQEWTDVELNYSIEQRCVYVLGRRNGSATKTTVIPLNVSQEINFSMVGRLLSLGKENDRSLILALCESDSTVVYYNLARGMQAISSVARKDAENFTTEPMDFGIGR